MQLSHHQEENFPALEPHHHGLHIEPLNLQWSDSAHRVEDHFHREDSDSLSFEQPRLTKTLSFNDCDDARLANDIFEEQDNQCERQFVKSHDRNSSDETVTESRMEDDSYFYLPNNQSPVQLNGLSDLFFRKSPISSPDCSAVESSMLIEDAGINDYTVTESDWPTNFNAPGNCEDTVNNATIECSKLDSDDQDATERLPVISREGLRHQQKSRRGGYQQNRVRKSGPQVEQLKQMYEETGGKLDRKQRKRICKATGLSWIQVYKWIFDMQTKENERQCASLPSYAAASPYQIFRVIGRDGKEIGRPLPIFKVEKVERRQSLSQ